MFCLDQFKSFKSAIITILIDDYEEKKKKNH